MSESKLSNSVSVRTSETSVWREHKPHAGYVDQTWSCGYPRGINVAKFLLQVPGLEITSIPAVLSTSKKVLQELKKKKGNTYLPFYLPLF